MCSAALLVRLRLPSINDLFFFLSKLLNESVVSRRHKTTWNISHMCTTELDGVNLSRPMSIVDGVLCARARAVAVEKFISDYKFQLSKNYKAAKKAYKNLS